MWDITINSLYQAHFLVNSIYNTNHLSDKCYVSRETCLEVSLGWYGLCFIR